MRRALAGLVLLVVAALCITRVVEHDTPWYLAAGDLIVQSRSLPRVDPFSYTSTRAWLNHEWLAEVLLALLHRVGGFTAIGLVQGVLLAGAVGVLAWSTRMRSGLAGLAPLVWIVLVFALREWSGPRAQLLSVTCFALTLALVEQDEQVGLWWCVPIQLVWTQVHGGNPTGVALLGVSLLASPSLRGALVVALCALATLAGPYGWRVHGHFLGAHAQLPYIREWEPLSVQLLAGSVMHWLVLVMMVGALVALLPSRGPRARRELLLLAVFAIVALRYQRFALEASMIAAVVLAPALGRLTASRVGHLARVVTTLLAVGALSLASQRSFGFGLDPARFPENAVAWLRANHPSGPMFNSYNYGGYLLWAWPEQKVFIDGRAFTVYDESTVAVLPALYAAPQTYLQLQDRYGFRLAVLQREGRGAALVAWLRERVDWRVVYEDAMTVIFARSS